MKDSMENCDFLDMLFLKVFLVIQRENDVSISCRSWDIEICLSTCLFESVCCIFAVPTL